jgi:glycosyltransferase involved in cell wall biosynthesis
MISIVTPSYKQLGWLRLALASVADQEGVDVEHIVQDAGTEGVQQILKSQIPFSIDAHHSVKVFVEQDAGMYDAVNRGLARARGDICGYLNCDEQYLPGTLATVANFFAAHPEVDVLFGDMILVNNRAHPISYRRTILPNLRHIRFAHLNTATCATFFRRRLIERGFYFDPQWKSIGDQVWIEALLKAKVKMATLSEALAVFTQTGENLGAATISRSETLRRRGAVRFSKLQSAAVVIGHRLRKALAGAYRLRRVEIEIFTPDSPDERRQMVGWVGFNWARN